MLLYLRGGEESVAERNNLPTEKDTEWANFKGGRVSCGGKWLHCQSAKENTTWRISWTLNFLLCPWSSIRTVAEIDYKGSGLPCASFWKCLLEVARGDLHASSLQKTARSAVKQLDAKSLAKSFQGAKQMAALSTAAANSFIFTLFPGARGAQR